MRIILTAFLLTVTFFDFAQVIDDFSDGDFITNPAWTGEAAIFEVDVNHQLHLIAPPVTDTAYLSTMNSLIENVEWTFLVNLDFNPSSSNLARIYLVSDQSDLEENLNGYFVQVGGTSDEVSLYRQTGTSITEIIDGTDDLVDSNPVSVRVKVTRTTNGDWTLMTDNTGSLNFTSQGNASDNNYITSSYFGVFCKYTSTRSDKFYFDDFSIKLMALVDTIPPKIENIEVISNQVLLLWFTESVDKSTAEMVNNYVANNGLGMPSQVILQDTNKRVLELTYSSAFQDGIDYTLTVQNVEDDFGNVMSFSTIHFKYSEPFFGSYKDIVISELMSDPNPPVGLPDTEYLELFNNTNKTISLKDWTLSDGVSTVTFSDQLFFPQSYLLCYDPQSGANFGVFNTIEGPIPSLNNGGDAIVLRDNNGIVIDSVAYELS